MKQLVYFLLFIFLTSCGTTSKKNLNSGEALLKWVDNLTGDFSFKDSWSYPEGVYRNEFGQLSCDGLCPPEIYNMIDENGKIYEDSLASFYQLLDTTHLFHSIKSDAWTYEWADTDYVIVEKINKDTTVCFTLNNAATHSSLNLVITENIVKPTIVLIGIDSNDITYPCKSGQMVIDKKLWNKGILKAAFDFDFGFDENHNEQMYWKGNIYAKIENK
ncbi:MAG: hypothetical protein FWF52_09055 [Candidatus Azobacteroides sp.]|nr:hypothetical protein [Candidatus Azobacteroides sp.]